MGVKNALTAENLRSAYGGESMAHMRYLIWSDIAEKEGFPKIAKLLRAISFSEWVHARNHFTILGGGIGDHLVASGAVFGVGKTADNLTGGFRGEEFEIDQMYPVYLHTAEFQGEKAAARTFGWALEAEKIHARLFHEAHEAVKSGKDVGIDAIFICDICGHTAPGSAPQQCPVCKAGRDAYREF
ncbi:MAG: rubrerythrin family protein [Thermovirgaceae bacterium]|nr:rubrerythrin family protein [Thermovirgaceae bacterium]